MNAHIEAIAKQAFVAGLDTDPVLYYEVEQFAKLLVQECYLYIAGETGLMWDGGLNKTKEHFGVKE